MVNGALPNNDLLPGLFKPYKYLLNNVCTTSTKRREGGSEGAGRQREAS